MPLQIVRNDITKMKCDAIVNAANSSLLGGGGVDGAIHRAAGRGLLEECRKLGGCRTGDAKITSAYDLPCKYVIHTVGPVWQDGEHGEKELLASCYKKSLTMAEDFGCESVAFPLISSGAYGYPKDEALQVAVDIISEHLKNSDMTVYIVIFDRAACTIGAALFDDINAYIDDNYVNLHCNTVQENERHRLFGMHAKTAARYEKPLIECDVMEDVCAEPCAPSDAGLDRLMAQIDESFSEMLLRKIDESGMTDAQCYKKANIDRKLFSKIRGDVHYKPSKPTAIAFALSLELPLDELKEMLMKAGFALSHSSKFDIIIEYFVGKKNYNVFEINEALFAFDQPLLGV